MDPISITGTLIAVLQISGTVISALYNYRSGYKSASSDAARIITELNGLRGILESLLQALEKEAADPDSGSRNSSRLANFQALTLPDGELQRCLSDLEAVSVKLGGPEAGSLSGLKRVKQGLLWPLKAKEVEKLLQSVQRAKSTMQFALSADHAALTLEIHREVANLTWQFAESSMDQRRRDIQAWLCAPDPFPNHAAARRKRQPLTGNWFLDGEAYGSWISSSRSFLWLYGIPGAGKSILCSSIIEDLLNRQKENSIALAFYYFNFNDTGTRDITSLARALVSQLLGRIPNNSKFLENLHHEIDGKKADVDFLLKTLSILIPQLEQVCIVIDALDECDECGEVMKLIETMFGWNIDTLHILVASRNIPEIQEVITDYATLSVCLQYLTNNDIHLLIQERLSSDRKFQKWPYQVRHEIEEALIDGASGMFRWVVCQLDMLRNCVTLPALRKALKTLPRTLDETYERILANIDENYAADVRKLLYFLNFSPRTMSLLELVEIVAIDMDAEEPNFDPENRIPDPGDIMTMCSTLVTTEDAPYLPGPSWERLPRGRQSLKLAHFSVKEYLLSDRIKSSKLSMYSMDFTLGNLFIARTYLVYLLGPQFSGGHGGLHSHKSRYTSWPLFKAAVNLFPFHIGNADVDPDNATVALLKKLFSTRHKPNGGNYAAWVGGLIPEADSQRIINTPPLYYAASFGMTSIVKMLLADMPKAEIDLKGGRARATALHVACFRGHTKVVKLLLEAGADPNSKNSKGESCLYWANNPQILDYTVIYDLLLQHGAVEDRLSSGPPVGMLSSIRDVHDYDQKHLEAMSMDSVDGHDEFVESERIEPKSLASELP